MHRTLALCSASRPHSVRSFAHSRGVVSSSVSPATASFRHRFSVGSVGTLPPPSASSPHHTTNNTAAAPSFTHLRQPHRRFRCSGAAVANSAGSSPGGGIVYVDERDPAAEGRDFANNSSKKKMADDLCSSRSRVTGEEVMYGTKWLAFKHLTYVDPTGKERAWDMVGRATKVEVGLFTPGGCQFGVMVQTGCHKLMMF
jgi:8-amino-7-oxononanoate synthase